MEFFTRKPEITFSDSEFNIPSVRSMVVYKTKEQKLQEIDYLFKRAVMASFSNKGFCPSLLKTMSKLESIHDRIVNPPLSKYQQRELIKRRQAERKVKKEEAKAFKVACELAEATFMELMGDDFEPKRSKKSQKIHKKDKKRR